VRLVYEAVNQRLPRHHAVRASFGTQLHLYVPLGCSARRCVHGGRHACFIAPKLSGLSPSTSNRLAAEPSCVSDGRQHSTRN
jgi:hypothetical protein